MKTLTFTDVIRSGKHAIQEVIAAVVVVWEQMEKLAKLVIVPHNLYSFSDFLTMSS